MMTVWNQQYASGQQLRWWPDAHLIAFLGRRFDRAARNGLAVELGCGTGRNLWALEEWGFHAEGLDGSVAALALAEDYLQRRVAPDVRLHHATLPGLPWHDESAALALDIQTCQHLSPTVRQPTYHEIVRVLDHRGLFFSMHWLDGDQAEIFPAHPELQPLSLADYMKALTEVGLIVEEAELTLRTYHQRQHTARWMVIEARKP